MKNGAPTSIGCDHCVNLITATGLCKGSLELKNHYSVYFNLFIVIILLTISLRNFVS